MRNARRHLTEGRQPFGSAELRLHLVQCGNIDIESLIHGGMALFVEDGDAPAQDFTHRSIVMQKAEDRFIRLIRFDGQRKFAQDAIAIFRMDAFPKRFRIVDPDSDRVRREDDCSGC